MKKYLVGGAVRDKLLERLPDDLDWLVLCQDLQSLEQKLRKANYRIIYVDEARNLIRACLEQGKVEDYVFAESLEANLSRRDFTINAMAYDGETLYDPYGGVIDLQLQRLETVGDAYACLHSSPIRIMRAIRFASCFSLTFSPSIAIAIDLLKDELKAQQFESLIRQELNKSLAYSPYSAIATLTFLSKHELWSVLDWHGITIGTK